MEIAQSDIAAWITAKEPAPLGQLALATAEAERLTTMADALVSHFVQVCRDDGHSWSEIGAQLGVSKQAVQKRYVGAVEEVVMPSRTVQDHHGKYRPLWEWLRQQRRSSVEVSFAEVEDILGFALPPSSRTHPPHWHGYKGSAVARAIIDAGWRSRHLNLAAEQVTFVRVDQNRQ